MTRGCASFGVGGFRGSNMTELGGVGTHKWQPHGTIVNVIIVRL